MVNKRANGGGGGEFTCKFIPVVNSAQCHSSR